jgi:ferric-dicitrate binding protein FerR (iron transport regulator)
MRLPISKSQHCFGQTVGRRTVFALFMGTVLASAFGTPSNAADAAGRVEEIKGEAFADANNQHRVLEKSSTVYVGDSVTTGSSSRLTMLLGEDTTIRLGERAHLVIDRFLSKTGGEISLQSGPMLFERPSGSRPMPVKFKTSYGLLAVRGTTFFAGPSNNVFGVFVEQGSVVVSNAGGRVTLNAGEGTNLATPDSRPTAPVAWGKERIRKAFESVK